MRYYLKQILYYYSRFGVYGLLISIFSKFTKRNLLIKVRMKEISNNIYLRYGTSDILVFEQIFINREYDFISGQKPKYIIDAGANIGLASLYFANAYPMAKILAIEPEVKNFELLKKNLNPFPNVIPINAAIWEKNELIELIDPGIGEWGYQTIASRTNLFQKALTYKVEGMTVDRLMSEYKIDRIDILKIDIEGAEKEVFRDTSLWIGRIDSLIIELHERIKPGCNHSFYQGAYGFDNMWMQGENIILTKKGILKKR